jgi:hypothetical protein
MSSNLRSLCSMAGLGKRVAFLTLTESATLEFSCGSRCDARRFIAVHFMGDPQMLL